MITSLYLPDSIGKMQEFPAQTRDDVLKQMNTLRTRFPTYRSFAVAAMDQVLTESQRQGALILAANDLATCLLRNDGNGRFTRIGMPVEAQLSVINGMVAADFDGDGKLDVAMNGNDYGTEISVGRYDAMNGLYLRGDGKDGFSAPSILQSGLFIPGNGKALVQLRSAGGKYLLAAGQNRGPLKIFERTRSFRSLSLEPSDAEVLIHFQDGHTRREECYYGSSFLSQSGRFIDLSDQVLSVEVTDSKGTKRVIHY
jgi:FG-GAP-like repeat